MRDESRTSRVLLDLLTVRFLLSYSTKPIRIFGGLGLLSLVLDIDLVGHLSVVRLALGQDFGGWPPLLNVHLENRTCTTRRKCWMYPRKLLNLLKVCFSLALLAILLKQVGWQQTIETVGKARFTYLAAAFVIYLVGIVARAYRWRILLNALRMDTPLAKLTALYFVGTFFSNFLPTGIGGDVVRVYELSRQSKRPIESVGTVLLDRATGFLVLFLIALIALLFSYQLIATNIALAILLLCLGSWAGLGLILQRDWLERWGLLRIMARIRQLGELYESVTACGPKAIGGALAISFVFNALLIAVNYLIALSLGVEIPLWYFLLFIPLISFLLVLPISLSGLGVREGGYVYLFAQAGVSAPLALAMSLLLYALNVATGLIGGVLYVSEGVRGYMENRS